MTNRISTCDAFDARASELLEGTLDADTRTAMDAHAAACARCGALLADLAAVQSAATALPDLVPSRDLWPAIEARIAAPIVPLPPGRNRSSGGARALPFTRRTAAWLGAAAAALVMATALSTYAIVSHTARRSPAVSTVAAARPSSNTSTRSGATTGERTQPVDITPRTAPTTSGTAGLNTSGRPAVSAVAATHVRPVEQLYDRQIAQLVTILRDRRSQLDTGTVTVIEHNLRIIDRAIAESRTALARDPGSRLLNDQLNSVLDQKVELLRTAALLPAGT